MLGRALCKACLAPRLCGGDAIRSAARRPIHARPTLSLHPPKWGSPGVSFRAAVGFEPNAWLRFRTRSAVRSHAAKLDAHPASAFPASSWGHPRETQAPSGSCMLLPSPQAHLQTGAFVTSRLSSLLRSELSAAAKFSLQGLRPRGKVVSHFTVRGRERFFPFEA